MNNNESDWEEVKPEEAGEDRPESEEKETSRQSLTPKAIDLMEKISEYGYLTMHEVQFVFGNKTWSYKVMKGLRSQGFIADHDTLMSPRTAHYLTPIGYRVLGKLGRLKVGIRFKPERYTVFIFRHRMACAKVGLLLEKHPLVHEFLPESRLFKRRKNEEDKLCDGEFWYKVEGREPAERVGLEVELSLKSNPRLDETFRQLARRDDLDQVWWICADENVRRAMRREVQRRYLGSQRHFFALLAEFLAAKGKAEMMEPTGRLLSIDPDKPTLLPRQPEPPPPPPAPRPMPKPIQTARAEAPRQPQPEPPLRIPPRPNPLVVFFWCAWDTLHDIWDTFGAIWQWIRESWKEERYFSENYIWETRWRFTRWGVVIPYCITVLSLAGIYIRINQILHTPPPPAKRRMAKRMSAAPPIASRDGRERQRGGPN